MPGQSDVVVENLKMPNAQLWHLQNKNDVGGCDAWKKGMRTRRGEERTKAQINWRLSCYATWVS